MVIGLSGAHLDCYHTNYNKLDKQAVGVQFVYHRYDYKPSWNQGCDWLI